MDKSTSPSHCALSTCASASRNAAYDWLSLVRSHTLTLEHAAIDIDTDRVLYHMELELETPLPPGGALDHAQFICLTWPYGGLWKINNVSADRTRVTCLSWRKTDLKHEAMDDLAREVSTLGHKVEALHSTTLGTDASDNAILEASAAADDLDAANLPHLFGWKMMRGTWGDDDDHWFIRDVSPPDESSEPPLRRHLVAKLFVNFAPVEARIEVNAVTAIDTIAQTYSADVTWQVTLPAITAVREDSVLLEFLDIVEIDARQFEFNNINEMKDERTMTSSVTPAGEIHFRDLTLPGIQAVDRPNVENVYHLQFSRRVVASFTEQMTLHSFPFDQQKLVFEFSTGSSGMLDGGLQLIPAPVDPGSFSIEDFQLGNVFDVAYHNKIFVSEIKESGPRKRIAFEMVLQRRSGYYLTNVALIAAVITYLCFFVSWSPELSSDGGNELVLMETGTRLQNVTAMVLTAVTFKNQVASLIPQISYFTMLDSYVFVCFMVTSLVTLENALFPLLQWYIFGGRQTESALLGLSLVAFTLFNIVWAVYLRWWLSRRRAAAKVLMQLHEDIRLITELVPAHDRAQVFERFLHEKKLAAWCTPKFIVTCSGDIHLQAPDDIPVANAKAQLERTANFNQLQQEALAEVAVVKRIYSEMRPARLGRRVSTAPAVGESSFAPVGHKIPAAGTSTAAYQAGTSLVPRMANFATPASQVDANRRIRRQSNPTTTDDTVVTVESFGGSRDQARTQTTTHGRRVF